MTADALYDFVLTILVLAVVVAFGVVFAYPVLDAQMRKAGRPQPPVSATIASISICEPFGSADTPIVTRAGGPPSKNSP